MKAYYLLTVGDDVAKGSNDRLIIDLAYLKAKAVWEKKKLPSKEPKMWQLIKEEKQ